MKKDDRGDLDGDGAEGEEEGDDGHSFDTKKNFL